MSFGRQKNMQRRASRPNETFHRDKRRKGLDKLGMLEASKGIVRRPSLLERIIGSLFRRGKK